MTEKEFADIVNSTKGLVLSAIEKNLAGRFYHAIDDIVQETYLRAYRSLVNNKFKGDSSMETWLYKIARNESLRMGGKLAREEKKFQRSFEKFEVRGAKDENMAEMEIEELREKIGFLPETYRDLLNLLACGYTEREISEKLDLKIGTVKSRTYRGREMLKKLYMETGVHLFLLYVFIIKSGFFA